MKEQIYEINITLEMLEENPLIIQYAEKKETGNLNASNPDTLTCSQSLKKKVMLNSLNCQEFINNLAYAGVPDVIKNGVIIDSDFNHKNRGYNYMS